LDCEPFVDAERHGCDDRTNLQAECHLIALPQSGMLGMRESGRDRISSPARFQHIMPHTSLSLLEQIRQESDADAWERFVIVYTPWLTWVVRHASVSANDADDLRQDVLAVVFQEIGGFQHNGQTGAFRRWLRNIVLNRLRSHWRKRRTFEQLESTSELRAVADPFPDLEAMWEREHDRHVTEALLKLVEPAFTQSTWLAFRRQVLHGLRAEEVASELGISVNAALLAKSRVLRRLRDEAAGLIDEI